MLLKPYFFGSAIGLAIAVPLYFAVPAYANFINWQFQNPLVLLPAALVGVGLAIITV